MGSSGPFVALIVLLLLASWGWGRAAVALMTRSGWVEAPTVINAPVQMVLGVALYLGVGGYAVALDVARLPFLLGWQIVGAALLVPPGVRTLRRASLRGRSLTRWLSGAAIAVVAALIGFMAVGTAMAHSAIKINPNDDDPAYVYFAQRLLETGGLIDPFNQRRLTSYGGTTLYHALFLQVSGNSSLRGFEFVFAAAVLIVVTVATLRRRWVAFGAVVIGIGVLLGHGLATVANLSPEYSIAALSLGLYQILSRLRADPERSWWLHVVVGVLLAGVLALRFTYVISVGTATLVVVIACYGRRAGRPIATIAGTGVLATGGWAVALLRSSGTPFFPLIAGNYNTAWPSRDPALAGLHGLFSLVRSVFDVSDVGAVAVVSGAVGALLLFGKRRPTTGALVLTAAALGCLVQLLVLVYVFSGSDIVSIARFEAPSTMACGLFGLGLLWPCRPQAPATRRLSAPVTRLPGALWSQLGDTSRARQKALLAGGFSTLAILALSGVTFGTSAGTLLTTARGEVHTGFEIVAHSTDFTDRYVPVRADFDALNAVIPVHAKVLAATDYTALLDFSRFTFATLDQAGGTSPPPGMPFFQGPTAAVQYLRHLGYSYIVTASPAQPGLYRFHSWVRNLRRPQFVFKAWTPYFVDWQATVNALEASKRYPVVQFGTNTLIRIR
jgi:hypothetical protein